MKKDFLPLLFALLCSVVVLSCQKEVSSDFPTIDVPELVQAAVSGRVLDENGLPLQAAVVKAGTATTSTDINGHFSFTNTSLNRATGYVTVEKAGYFKGSRTFLVQEAGNYVEIQLIPKTIIGSFDAAAGGQVAFANGAAIQFAPNSIAKNGVAYNGIVSVAAHLIHPEAADFAATMPGTLIGLSANGEQKSLESYGMMAVELLGANGELLNIASGKTATLQFPIPASLQAAAPATIPLWFFDEEKGLWIEEGSAGKKGNLYEGTVSHFSFWNVDAPFPLVQINAQLKQTNGEPLVNARVHIRVLGDSAIRSGSGYTDSRGNLAGYVPANKNLQLVVYSACGSPIFQLPIGPFTANSNLGTITAGSWGKTYRIGGLVTDCNNAPVANGFVDVRSNGQVFRGAVQNGQYVLNITTCAEGIASIVATDMATGRSSDADTVGLASSGTLTKNLKLCGQSSTEFIQFSVDTLATTLTGPADSLSASQTTLISGRRITATEIREINFGFNGSAIGVFPIQSLDITVNSNNYKLSGGVPVNITEYGSFVAGSFSGSFTDRNGSDSVRVSASFRIRR